MPILEPKLIKFHSTEQITRRNSLVTRKSSTIIPKYAYLIHLIITGHINNVEQYENLGTYVNKDQIAEIIGEKNKTVTLMFEKLEDEGIIKKENNHYYHKSRRTGKVDSKSASWKLVQPIIKENLRKKKYTELDASFIYKLNVWEEFQDLNKDATWEWEERTERFRSYFKEHKAKRKASGTLPKQPRRMVRNLPPNASDDTVLRTERVTFQEPDEQKPEPVEAVEAVEAVEPVEPAPTEFTKEDADVKLKAWVKLREEEGKSTKGWDQRTIKSNLLMTLGDYTVTACWTEQLKPFLDDFISEHLLIKKKWKDPDEDYQLEDLECVQMGTL